MLGILRNMVNRDERQEQLRPLIVVLILVLVSFFKSCEEIHYTVSGKDTVATVYKVGYEHIDNKPTGRVQISYQFVPESGKKIIRRTTITEDEIFFKDQEIKIQYLDSGSFDSRLAGERNTIWLIIFLSLLGLAGAGVVYVLRTAEGNYS